jgi:hypothetical protein
VRPFILTAVAILFLGSPSRARTWNVPADAPTIAAGFDSAAVGDVVEFAGGTDRDHRLALKSGVTLRSQTGEPASVIIDGDNLDSVIVCKFVDPPATIEGLTLTHGFALGLYPSGGGLACRAADLAVRRCRFEDNAAGWGGGLHEQDSRLTVDDYVLAGNHAYVGGAGIDCSGGALRLTNCDVTGNDLPAGAVVLVRFDSRLGLSGCTLDAQPQPGVVGLFLQNARVAGWFDVFNGLGGAAIRAEYGAVVNLNHATIAANGQGLVAADGVDA